MMGHKVEMDQEETKEKKENQEKKADSVQRENLLEG